MKKVVMLVLMVVIGCGGKKWYEGGTLHKATAIEWQNATIENKLATCADFAATMYQKKLLKEELSSKVNGVDSIRPIAQALVEFLDATFKKEEDPVKNDQRFANSKVDETVAIGATLMGILK